MGEAEVSRFLCILIKMGEALQNSGAEVFRVEDTLNRIAAAYGAQEVNVFVITSSIVVTLTMPQLPPQTQTRRLRHASGNDLLMLEELNALSRRICAAPPSVEEFQRQLDAILAQRADPRLRLAGSVLAASSFAVFFGGSLWDGLLAGVIAVLVFWIGKSAYQFGYNVFNQQAVSPGAGQEVTVVIPEGSSTYEVAKILKSKGLIEDSTVFYAQEKLSTYKGKMKAGTYLLSTAYTPARIMGILAGDEEQTGVTQDTGAAADTAADSQTTDAGTDAADTQNADGTADTQATDGTAVEGESGQ